jgi:alpha/beta superfamily hydrolase
VAKVNALPPVPDDPVLPPEVALRDEERVSIVADDGTKLDGRVVVPRGARRVIVVSHPHPQYGGTMNNAVVVAIAKVATERGAAVLRFDFRGVGESQGSYGGGEAEIADVIGALRTASSVLPGAPVTSVGYSFGSWVSLRAVMRRAVDVERIALVAPASRIFDFFKSIEGPAFEGPKAIALGDRDEFCDVDEGERIAAHLGASFCVVQGADHFFLDGRRRLAEVLAPFVLGESDTLPARVGERSA